MPLCSPASRPVSLRFAHTDLETTIFLVGNMAVNDPGENELKKSDSPEVNCWYESLPLPNYFRGRSPPFQYLCISVSLFPGATGNNNSNNNNPYAGNLQAENGDPLGDASLIEKY